MIDKFKYHNAAKTGGRMRTGNEGVAEVIIEAATSQKQLREKYYTPFLHLHIHPLTLHSCSRHHKTLPCSQIHNAVLVISSRSFSSKAKCSSSPSLRAANTNLFCSLDIDMSPSESSNYLREPAAEMVSYDPCDLEKGL